MATIYDYPITPPPTVPDGLQLRADWMGSPPSPPPYTPMSHNSPYEPHDSPPCDCVHARRLCEERYIDLQDQVFRLDEYCRRPHWTKSFFGSIKQRALSIKSRRKSHNPNTPPEKGQEQEAEWPGESHPASLADELHGYSLPAELPLSYGFRPELAAPSWPHPPPRRNAYPSLPTPSTHPFGHGYTGYRDDAGIPGPLSAPSQPQARDPPVFELPAQPHNPTSRMHIATSYASTPNKSLTGYSSMSQSSASTQGSSSTVSPQSSISSVSTAPSTAPKFVDDGAPLFADATTSSPVEYDQEDGMAPWDKQPTTAQQSVEDPTTTAAELPASPLDLIFETTQWLRGSRPGSFPSQLGHAIPLSPCSMGSPPPSSGRTSSMSSLASGSDAQSSPQHAPSPAPILSSTAPSRPIDLGNVRKTFSEMRRNPAWHGGSVVILSEMEDDGALLGALDELENTRQGRIGDLVLHKLCLAYLTLSMAVEMGDASSRPSYATLHEAMAEFLGSEGEYGLPECFLAVANAFLYALYYQVDSDPGQRHTLQMMDGERRPTMLALGIMRAHFFQAHCSPHPHQSQPRIPHGRRHSYDSTTSTVLDVAMVDEAQPISAMETADELDDFSVSSLPSQQNLAQDGPTALTRARRRSFCCHTCSFFPADGPDQRKKMERHKLTNKHRTNTGDEAGEAEQFGCTFCGSTFNRRDNFRQHLKKHGRQRSAAETRGKKQVWRNLGTRNL